MEAAVTITMGKFVNLGLKVTRGKKDMPESLVTMDFSESIDIATGFKVILSDVETSQHWLADGASTILHLCRAWLTGRYTRTAPKSANIAASIWTYTNIGGPQTSYETLTSIQNRTLRLYPSELTVKCKEIDERNSTEPRQNDSTVEQEWLLLQDKIWRYYHWLELLHDRMDPTRTPEEIELIRKGGNAVGFEFVEILRERELKPRTLRLQDSARAWLGYSRNVNAIHIIGRDFGDLITPKTLLKHSLSGTASSCSHEGVAPRGRDYLMAPLSVLRERLGALAHTESCAQVADGLHWCNVDRCFDMHKHQDQEQIALSTCDSLINSLHCKHSIVCASRKTACTGLPGVFARHPQAAIIIGTRLLTKTVQKKRATSDDREPRDDAVLRRQLRSDSGYVSNKGSNASQDSPVADESAEIASQKGYKIRGVADTSRRLRKRRKND